ncbi:MAG: thiamine pyrophosphate-binding protein [Desulfohalobiaceae bacterium]|nr:thiamine pyrophosphate-binding protein [Desulfohalobiaceae bacterium]
MNGAEVLVEMLKRYQVETIFGVPGDTSIPLYDALHAASSSITHIMARDERSSAFMADTYARLSHKPGVCECPSGAGPLYILPGVAEADASSIPLLVFTSDIPLAGEGKKTITELDCQKLFEPVTKWSHLVKDTARLPEIIRRAFRVATTGRPGAVHLAFPQEVLSSEFPGQDMHLYSEEECQAYPAYRTRGSRAKLEQVCSLLMQAKRPVLIAGGGTNHSQASEEILELAETLNSPVVTTISGQGIMPDEHELALGVIGDNGYHPHAHQAVEEGDVLLYCGCKLGSVSTIKWTLPSFKPERKILQIDLDPELLSNNYKNEISVAGDARLVLRDLVSLLHINAFQAEPSAWVDELNRLRSKFWQESAQSFRAGSIPLKPQQVIYSLNQRLQNPAIVIADAGTPTPYITRFLKLTNPESNFIIPRAYGGLGYAIPALVGAHSACPGANLIGLFGDGSLGMSAGELETLSRLQIPAILIHFNNGSFGWIKALQSLHSQEKYFSVDFTPGDPAMVARGFGVQALTVKTPQDLEAGLDQAFAGPGPVFLDVLSESEVSEMPPVFSWERAARKHKKPEVHT